MNIEVSQFSEGTLQRIYTQEEQYIGGSNRVNGPLPSSGKKLRRNRSGGPASFYGTSLYGGHYSNGIPVPISVSMPLPGDGGDLEDDWDSELQINDFLHSFEASPAPTVD